MSALRAWMSQHAPAPLFHDALAEAAAVALGVAALITWYLVGGVH